ncbi:response regulator [Egibacter rhizosphaerae]|uniref:Response regulator n=1 Tax=Egibacter rhizosphaerae TaxID=1670831 RepID=A0A411YK08_9ACTN|nr:response regulator [Egibacter rhizosphaerae]QBI21549.1 response regulator [Egibacter rhizosphaerae]
MAERILVVDHEPETRRFVEVNLRLSGYDVETAETGRQALAFARESTPDLVVTDVATPDMDGCEMIRALRARGATSHVPVIVLTSRALTGDRVLGLTAGADDYLRKPCDPAELVARARSLLNRVGELRATSPLTGLPGNHRIDRELARRVGQREPLALAYADLNHFKTFNDRYGFLRGDDVLALTAQVTRDAVATCGDPEAFAGHIGGDDFMVLLAPDCVTGLCETIIAEFDRQVPSLYDDEDAARGYLELEDRRGRAHRAAIVSIAIGVATTERRWFADHRAIVEVATELKTFVKHNRPGSAYAIDGRRDHGPPAPRTEHDGHDGVDAMDGPNGESSVTRDRDHAAVGFGGNASAGQGEIPDRR